MASRDEAEPPEEQILRKCHGCGNAEAVYVSHCPFCGEEVCDVCDTGGMVECDNCEDNPEPWEQSL